MDLPRPFQMDFLTAMTVVYYVAWFFAQMARPFVFIYGKLPLVLTALARPFVFIYGKLPLVLTALLGALDRVEASLALVLHPYVWVVTISKRALLTLSCLSGLGMFVCLLPRTQTTVVATVVGGFFYLALATAFHHYCSDWLNEFIDKASQRYEKLCWLMKTCLTMFLPVAIAVLSKLVDDKFEWSFHGIAFKFFCFVHATSTFRIYGRDDVFGLGGAILHMSTALLLWSAELEDWYYLLATIVFFVLMLKTMPMKKTTTVVDVVPAPQRVSGV